jgi:hypothetical protein
MERSAKAHLTKQQLCTGCSTWWRTALNLRCAGMLCVGTGGGPRGPSPTGRSHSEAPGALNYNRPYGTHNCSLGMGYLSKSSIGYSRSLFSLAWFTLLRREALKDAEAAVRIRPKWTKAYSRMAVSPSKECGLTHCDCSASRIRLGEILCQKVVSCIYLKTKELSKGAQDLPYVGCFSARTHSNALRTTTRLVS